jgi:GNAT superfamily N-acetyltransferase
VKKKLAITTATEADVAAIVSLRQAADRHLVQQFGDASWTTSVSEKSVLRDLKTSRVLVARRGADIVATARLATKKPWAIDLKYFASVSRALYLHDMAVEPAMQRKGIGRDLVAAAIAVAKVWPAGAVRLDAYDGRSGAGPFYAKCGFREVGRVTYRNTPLIYYEMLL